MLSLGFFSGRTIRQRLAGTSGVNTETERWFQVLTGVKARALPRQKNSNHFGSTAEDQDGCKLYRIGHERLRARWLQAPVPRAISNKPVFNHFQTHGMLQIHITKMACQDHNGKRGVNVTALVVSSYGAQHLLIFILTALHFTRPLIVSARVDEYQQFSLLPRLDRKSVV